MSGDDTLTRLAQALGPKYQVRRLVGRGGFAEVYEVWDTELERRLAVKVLRPDIAWTAGMLERFKRETRAVARLEHPNILAIHFVGEGEGLAYYAMPFVEGLSLGDLLRRAGALPAERALAIAVPILEALQHAHEAGLLHRDIKPDNIMLDAMRGRPLLVDFGIARRLDPEAGANLTQTGLVVGTPHYMSPEQALGDPQLDHRSDIYSMGAVLFQMITGHPPFDGDSSQEIVGKHIAEPPPAPIDIDRRIPRRVSDVVARCLAKQPGDRFQSATQVLAALEAESLTVGSPSRALAAQRAIASVTGGAQPTVPMPAAPRRSPRRLALRTAAIALPLLTLGAAALWWTTPRLTFENQLVDSVAVWLDGVERRVPPGGRFVARLEREPAIEVTWRLVRPTLPNGIPVGVPVGDTLVLRDPPARVTLRAAARTPSRAYFAPLITNQTGRPIRLIVNAGLVGALDCGCTVPPGGVRLPIGYYPLFGNSSVRAQDADGRAATFRDLGPQVDRASGVVGLRFRAEDLR